MSIPGADELGSGHGPHHRPEPQQTTELLLDAAAEEFLEHGLEEEADQLSRMIEIGKDQGLCDPDLSTPAMSLLCQAVGIGTDLLLTAGPADRHIPSEHDWSELVTRLVAAVVPTGEEPPATPEPATSEHAPSDGPAARDGLSW